MVILLKTKLSVAEPGSPGNEDSLLKIVSSDSIQPVRKSGMVVLVYDSVDKKKTLGK